MTQAVFAIPGDKDRRTGGFIYEARVLDELNALGCATRHLVLPDSFPDPTPKDMETTLEMLRAVPPKQPIILDGLVSGAIDPDGLASVQAPVIAMVHHPLGLETGLNAARADALLQNEAAALRHMAHIIVPSPHTADILIQDFGADRSRITIAPPGFDRPTTRPAPVDPPLILSVGLLAPRKGHDVLLDALAQITDLPWQAEIVGKAYDAQTAEALRRQRDSLGLEGRVEFMGEMPADPLAQRFAAARVFALATRYEGYGMVLSEAMLHGLPVVSCSVGAVPDTVGDAGILVPPDDAAAFAQGLARTLSRADVFAEKSKARARLLPSWRDTAQHFVDVVGRLSPRG